MTAQPHRDPLRTYRRKRNFRQSPEPQARRTRRRPRGGPIFVVQKHDATTLHYDFRLEVGGVLKSWAVPKRPSPDPEVKRLAIPTEDHPLEYARFKGEIPEGEYGAGTVEIWDRGTYQNRTTKEETPVPIDRALSRGHAVVALSGKKLKGQFVLNRIGRGRKARWLLAKMREGPAKR